MTQRLNNATPEALLTALSQELTERKRREEIIKRREELVSRIEQATPHSSHQKVVGIGPFHLQEQVNANFQRAGSYPSCRADFYEQDEALKQELRDDSASSFLLGAAKYIGLNIMESMSAKELCVCGNTDIINISDQRFVKEATSAAANNIMFNEGLPSGLVRELVKSQTKLSNSPCGCPVSCSTRLEFFGKEASVSQYVTANSPGNYPVHMITVTFELDTGEEAQTFFYEVAAALSDKYGHYDAKWKDIALAKDFYEYKTNKKEGSMVREEYINPNIMRSSYYFANYQIELHPLITSSKNEILLIYRDGPRSSMLKQRYAKAHEEETRALREQELQNSTPEVSVVHISTEEF